MRPRTRYPLPLAVALASACALLPSPRDEIRFPHAVHEDELDCTDCHGAVARSTDLSRRHLPDKPSCEDCHDDVRSPAGCSRCHSEPDRAAGYAPGGRSDLRLSHASHLERTQGACRSCHLSAPGGEVDADPHGLLPVDHDRCAPCHRADLDQVRCRRCHVSLAAWAAAPESLYRHGDGYLARHGAQARAGADACAQCHDPTFCADCHADNAPLPPSVRFPDRVDRGFIHRGDWLSAHPAQAAHRRTQCLRCHGPAHCDSCHERTGLGAHLAVPGARPHPAGWLQAVGPVSPHGRAARRDIVRCAACHDQGPLSNCVECHRSGGVPPHPPGWSRTGRAGEPTCLICHLQ